MYIDFHFECFLRNFFVSSKKNVCFFPFSKSIAGDNYFAMEMLQRKGSANIQSTKSLLFCHSNFYFVKSFIYLHSFRDTQNKRLKRNAESLTGWIFRLNALPSTPIYTERKTQSTRQTASERAECKWNGTFHLKFVMNSHIKSRRQVEMHSLSMCPRPCGTMLTLFKIIPSN